MQNPPLNETQTEEFKTVDNMWQEYNIPGKMIICPNIYNLNRNPLKLKKNQSMQVIMDNL